jgi:hypothetical protein
MFPKFDEVLIRTYLIVLAKIRRPSTTPPARISRYEAVGVPVEGGLQRLVREEVTDVRDERVALEVGHRAGLGGRQVRRVADREDVRGGLGLQGVWVGGHEAELVTEPG